MGLVLSIFLHVAQVIDILDLEISHFYLFTNFIYISDYTKTADRVILFCSQYY